VSDRFLVCFTEGRDPDPATRDIATGGAGE
jgi:hypothetical protein